MPELPEVERARKVLHAGAVGKTVTDAASVMDEIVFGSKETAERFVRHFSSPDLRARHHSSSMS